MSQSLKKWFNFESLRVTFPLKVLVEKVEIRNFQKKKITRTYDRKDDDSREHRREAIRQADHDGVTITIIIHWVVRRERYQTAES